MTAAKRLGNLAAARSRCRAQIEDSICFQLHGLHALKQAVEGVPVHEVVVGEKRRGLVQAAYRIAPTNRFLSLLGQHQVAKDMTNRSKRRDEYADLQQ